jgi:hypothetical protein
MTFSMTLISDNQPRIVGTLWANDEDNARSLATLLRPCAESEQLKVSRTDDREIPFRLAEQSIRIV